MMLVDGRPAKALPLDDRGLAYGDGAFETLRWERGRAPWFARHHARLAATCAALGFAAPASGDLAAEVAHVAGDRERAVVKVIVTRGGGGRGYSPAGAVAPRRMVVAHEWPGHPASHWRDGVAVRTCATRLPADGVLPGHKHLNRLPQVLARAEWSDPAIAEGLMLDAKGDVVEATAANLFAVVDGELVTPPIAGAGVAGVARAWILERAGPDARIRALPRAALDRASEVFLTNAVNGVWPVRELDGAPVRPGPVGARWRDALAAEGIGP